MSITLGQLREQLAALVVDGCPDDTLVVMSQDAEGNGFSPLDEVEVAMYAAETTWHGERYMTDADRLAAAGADTPYGPDDYAAAPDDAVTAVFLWPVN